jgi:hypothetical protein
VEFALAKEKQLPRLLEKINAELKPKAPPSKQPTVDLRTKLSNRNSRSVAPTAKTAASYAYSNPFAPYGFKQPQQQQQSIPQMSPWAAGPTLMQQQQQQMINNSFSQMMMPAVGGVNNDMMFRGNNSSAPYGMSRMQQQQQQSPRNGSRAAVSSYGSSANGSNSYRRETREEAPRYNTSSRSDRYDMERSSSVYDRYDRDLGRSSDGYGRRSPGREDSYGVMAFSSR